MVADEEDPREIYCQEAKLVSYQDPRALDEALLAIVKLRGGVISLSETCSFLGVSMEDLMDSIDRLQHSRRLVLE